MGRYRRKADPAAILLVVLLSAGVVGATAFLVWLTSGPSPYDGVDQDTYCRIDGPRSITVVLIDATDRLTAQQNERLLVELTKLRDAVPRFDRIVLAAIDGRDASSIDNGLISAARTLFTGCNPGKVKDGFREAPRLVAQAYADFDKPFRAGLAEVLAGASADRSPIIEAIEHVTVEVFGPLPDGAPVRKRLIVVSDMLQNTPALSFYGNMPEFSGFRSSDQFRLHRPSLAGVEVAVWEINRPRGTEISRAKVADFWQRYFTELGAVLSRELPFWDATKI